MSHSISLLLLYYILNLISIVSWAKIPKIEEDDIIRVYSHPYSGYSRQNLLVDSPFLICELQDRVLLNDITPQFIQGINHHDRSHEIFIEVCTKHKNNWGLLISQNGCILLEEGRKSVSFRCPNAVKSQVVDFIEKYSTRLLPQKQLNSYCHLPMVIQVDTIPLLFASRKKNQMFHINFFLQTDSLHVCKLSYELLWKKDKLKRINRWFTPVWDEYSHARIGEMTDQATNSSLHHLFPEWSEMDNPQRMRWLDSCMIVGIK